jgi:hypothetical protein
MSLIAPRETERSRADAQALIAEARARARRRRLKIVAALIVLAIMAVTGVLIGRAETRSPAAATARPRPASLAAHSGIVTGHLSACFAIPPSNGRPRVTPGTVVALRGQVTEKPSGPGMWTLVFPKGPAVASERISNNYDQTFRFALPPGRYVIAGRYDGWTGYGPNSQVTVTAGATIRVNLPDVCE